MLKKSLLVLGLVGVLATGAMADVVLTYDSDIDVIPGGIIDLDPGNVATITINASATAGEDGLGAAGFVFEGAAGGGVVDNTGIVMSDFLFAAAMQDPGMWLTNNALPNPAGVAFFPLAALDFPVALATLTLTAPAVGDITVDWGTGPVNFADRNVNPLTVADGSDSFTVHVTPEPATLVLLAMGGIATIRRRR